MIPFWFLPYAIACGNTVVLKPSERVPLTMQKVFELVDAVGLPAGVLNLVNGGRDVVNALARSSRRPIDQLRGVQCGRPPGLCEGCGSRQARAVPGRREESCCRPAGRRSRRRRRRHRRQRIRMCRPAMPRDVAGDHRRRGTRPVPRRHARQGAVARRRVRSRRGRADGPGHLARKPGARASKAIDQAVAEGARPLADGRNLAGAVVSAAEISSVRP